MSMRVLVACKRVIDYAVKVTLYFMYPENSCAIFQYIEQTSKVFVGGYCRKV